MNTIAATTVLNDQEIKGHIDGIVCGLLTGWIYDPSCSAPEIQLIVNGIVEQVKTTDMVREDVALSLGLEGVFGFSFVLDELPLEYISWITIAYEGASPDFTAQTYSYCPLVDEFRHDLKAIFFSEFYRKKYALTHLNSEEALRYYLSIGIYQDQNPNPWFSTDYISGAYPELADDCEIPVISYLINEPDLLVNASIDFSALYYSENNKIKDRSYSYLSHYVNGGHKSGLVPIGRYLPESLIHETTELAEIEPELDLLDCTALKVIKYPVLGGSTYLPGEIKQKYGDRIKVVICVPYISCGGADLIATYVLKAYQTKYSADQVLLIVTDKTTNDMPHWLDPDTNVVFLSKEHESRGPLEKVQVLHTIIGRLCPERVFNINSQIAWELYARFGAQLSGKIDLDAYLFCFDFDTKMRRVGYIRDYIPKTIGKLSRIYCDNRTVIEEMNQLYGFSDRNSNKFNTLYVPARRDGEKALVYGGCDKAKKNILWIGRLARQKRPDLLIAIAKRMPDLQFHVYGPEGDAPDCDDIVAGQYPNILYKGVYSELSEISFDDYCLYLNTSAWEGLPTIIIQMMSLSMPVVTSNVGGISELVNSQTGVLVEDENPDNYQIKIEEHLENRALATNRAEVGKQLVESRHNWDQFYSAMEQAGAFKIISNPVSKFRFFDRRRYRSKA